MKLIATASGKAASACLIGLTSSIAAFGSDLDYFTWSVGAGSTYNASVGNIDAELTFSATGPDALLIRGFAANNPAFFSSFGEFAHVFGIENGAAATAADGTASITFSQPLPEGSVLIAFDLDVAQREERTTLSSKDGAITYLYQIESQFGTTSQFPQWNALEQTLYATATSPNQEEATVFDISGLSSLDITYLRNDGGTGLSGANFAILTVPEPSGLAALLTAGCVLFARRRR